MRKKIERINRNVDKLDRKISENNRYIRTLEEKVWYLEHPAKYKIGDKVSIEIENKPTEVKILDVKRSKRIVERILHIFDTELAWEYYYSTNEGVRTFFEQEICS